MKNCFSYHKFIFSLFLIISGVRFDLKVDSEESIVNANQLFQSNLTFCVVCVFTLQTDEWCVHNRLFNANFEVKFKKTPDILP
jgi:hypothetical protein